MRRRTALLAALVATILLLMVPGLVLANTNEPIAATGGMSATLPLMGTGLTVEIALSSVGNITTVDVNPTSAALTKTKADPGYVRFATSDGKTSVSVLARGGRLTLTERTTLANLQGSGTWSANAFGTGVESVRYTIGETSGNPTVTLGTISTASGVTATVDAPKVTKSDKTKDSVKSTVIGWSTASAGVTFASAGWTKHLTISVKVKADGTAALSITLSGRDRQKLTGTLAQLAGARTWTAHECDGTPVTVDYHIASDGSIVFDSATPAATSKTGTGWLWVGINGTWVGMFAHLKSEASGIYQLVVQGFSGFCPTPKSKDHKPGLGDHHGDPGDKGGSGGDQGWGPGHGPH